MDSAFHSCAGFSLCPCRQRHRVARAAGRAVGYRGARHISPAIRRLPSGFCTSSSRFPGHYPARRLFSDGQRLCRPCVRDHRRAAPVMLPTYAIIMWVTVGNGLRFGSRYMIVAAVMAQLTLAVIAVLTPYWQANPILVFTLSLTALDRPALYPDACFAVSSRRAAMPRRPTPPSRVSSRRPATTCGNRCTQSGCSSTA